MSQQNSQKARNCVNAMLRRGAENTLNLLSKTWSGPLSELKEMFETTLARIESGAILSCECCGKSMPFFRLNENTFRTTCSEDCERSIQPASAQEEKFIRENCTEDILPGKLRILANLNSPQYGNKRVKIVAANIEKVEKFGTDAMVTVFHDHDNIPHKLRITAFAPMEQSAIIRSIIEEIPILKAKRLILREALSKVSEPKLLPAFC